MGKRADGGVGKPARSLRPAGWPIRSLAVPLAALLGGCTVAPGWANPAAWFRDEVLPPSRAEIDDVGALQGFPNLASVPDTPPPITAPNRRERMFAGLKADRRQANYTGRPSPAAGRGEASIAPGVDGQTARLPPQLPDSGYVAVIYFDEGSASLSEGDRQVLREVAVLYGEQDGGHVRIVGHASGGAAGPAEPNLDNFEISLRRAGAVAAELAGLGIDPARLQAIGMSDNQPVYYEFTPTGEAGNRRAEIYFER